MTNVSVCLTDCQWDLYWLRNRWSDAARNCDRRLHSCLGLSGVNYNRRCRTLPSDGSNLVARTGSVSYAYGAFWYLVVRVAVVGRYCL